MRLNGAHTNQEVVNIALRRLAEKGNLYRVGGRPKSLAAGSHTPRTMIVDSNTWADYFNGTQGPHAQRLDDALRQEEDLGGLPIIISR